MTFAEGFTVAQLGARMHYAVPRILGATGKLEQFYTDFFAGALLSRISDSPLSTGMPRAFRRLGGRVPQGVPGERITAFTLFGIEYAWRRRRARTRTDLTRAYLWAGREFCRRVLHAGELAGAGVYLFNSAGLEILHATRRRGMAGVIEQTIAPRKVAEELVREEQARFPTWERNQGVDALVNEYADREAEEWEAADRVVCGSEFVRAGVAQAGGPAGKCVVVPYGGDFGIAAPADSQPQRPKKAAGGLRILFVGTVELRKGVPYLVEAAKRLGRRAEVRIVGPVQLNPEVSGRFPSNIDVIGPVPRPEVSQHYRWADVFVLPSICEGSATVCYEALSAGLPVVTTPNAGSVVRDGIDGYIVPVRDPDALADRLERLLDNNDLKERMSESASKRASDFTLAKYGERLMAVLADVETKRRRAQLSPTRNA